MQRVHVALYLSLLCPPQAFEGMKAYRDAAGGIRLFRPDLNMRRLSHSMDRLAGPPLDGQGFTDCIAELVRQEHDWIPQGDGACMMMDDVLTSDLETQWPRVDEITQMN